jgi:hypothetical protein
VTSPPFCVDAALPLGGLTSVDLIHMDQGQESFVTALVTVYRTALEFEISPGLRVGHLADEDVPLVLPREV